MKPRSVPWLRILAEFAVIFLGVTLSLAADDWRQSRDLRTAERAALLELASDLATDSAELTSVLGRMQSWDQAAMWLFRNLSDGSTDSDQALRRAASLAFFDLYQPNSSAYSGLKAGGQLTLLTDAEVRRAVVAYYEEWQPYMGQFAARTARLHAGYEALFLEHALPSLADTAGSFWRPGPMAWTTSWNTFRSDPRVAPSITNLGVSAGNWAARIQEALEENAELRRLISAQITS